MRVKCIANSGRALPRELFETEPYAALNEHTEFAITPGNTYIVYGITISENYAWYYLCDDGFTYYPIWHPSPLFTIVDPRLSRYWEFEYTPSGRCESMSGIIVAYPEWARDPRYYDRLSDNDEAAVKVFEKYRKLIDEEAATWVQ